MTDAERDQREADLKTELFNLMSVRDILQHQLETERMRGIRALEGAARVERLFKRAMVMSAVMFLSWLISTGGLIYIAFVLKA